MHTPARSGSAPGRARPRAPLPRGAPEGAQRFLQGLPTLGQSPADFYMQLPPDFPGTEREVGPGVTTSSRGRLW